MDKISGRFLENVFLSLTMLSGHLTLGQRLKHNKNEDGSKRLSGQQNPGMDSNYSYFRFWCRNKSATF
jgi:hypothetical protein